MATLKTRVLIRQPVLPHYRLPVFQMLSKIPKLDVRLRYGRSENIKNVEPAGIDGGELAYAMRHRPFLGESYTDPGFWPLIDDFSPQVAILPWNARQRDLMPILAQLKRRGIASILWGHGYSKRGPGWRRWMRNRIGKAADALMIYSRTHADQLRRDGFAADRVFVAPNALDQSENFASHARWQQNPDELDACRTRYGVNGRRVLLFVSRLDPANRLDLLLEALPRVLQAYPDAVLLAAGPGDAEIQRLTDRAAELGVAEAVVFPGAVYDPHEVGGLMSMAEVFCYPAHMGLSLLHAFAFGLPVITSDRIDGHGPEIEAFVDHTNGLFYRHGDADDLATKVLAVLADADLRRQLGDNATQTVREVYTVKQMVKGMVEAIEAVTPTVSP